MGRVTRVHIAKITRHFVCAHRVSSCIRTSRVSHSTTVGAVVYIGASYAYNARTVGALGARGIRGMLACVLMTVLWSAGLFGW